SRSRRRTRRRAPGSRRVSWRRIARSPGATGAGTWPSLLQVGGERLPIPLFPAAVQVPERVVRHRVLGERELRALALGREREGRDGEDAGREVRRPPGLDDALVGNHLEVDRLDLAPVC